MASASSRRATSIRTSSFGSYSLTAVATDNQGATGSDTVQITVTPRCGSADFNHDGDLGTDADIEAFFRVLGGGPC